MTKPERYLQLIDMRSFCGGGIECYGEGPPQKLSFHLPNHHPRQAKCSSYWLDNVTQMLWGEKMRLVYKNVKKIYMGIVGVVFIVMTLSVIYQVLCRYVLHIAGSLDRGICKIFHAGRHIFRCAHSL